MARAWYASDGRGSVILVDNYILTNDKPACRTGFVVCSIYAAFTGEVFPSSLSRNIRNYIASGLTNGVPEPRLPLAAKKYVYMRNS